MNTLLLAQAQPQGGNAFISFLPIIILFFLFWVMIIVPQRRQAKQHAAMVAGLQKGDRVVTMGGLIGEIAGVRDDELQIRSGTSTVIVERARIARKVDAPAAQG
jgi:preprotein translocase subunit YajC